jgi:hypothetical protein
VLNMMPTFWTHSISGLGLLSDISMTCLLKTKWTGSFHKEFAGALNVHRISTTEERRTWILQCGCSDSFSPSGTVRERNLSGILLYPGRCIWASNSRKIEKELRMIKNKIDWKARTSLPVGKKGTQKWFEQFGENLLCVRYRYNKELMRRVTTVEIIVADVPWVIKADIPFSYYLVRFKDLAVKANMAIFVIKTKYKIGVMMEKIYDLPELRKYTPADWYDVTNLSDEVDPKAQGYKILTLG